MARKPEPGMAYDTKKLNKLFALLSILFLMTVVWVFLDDYIRPWKAIQLKSMDIKRQKLQEQIKQANEAVDAKKLAELEKNLDAAKQTVSVRKEDIRKVEKQLEDLNKQIKAETIINGTLNSNVAALTFSYETAHAANQPKAHDLFIKMRKTKDDFATSNNRLKGLGAEFKVVSDQMAALNQEVAAAEKSINEMTGTRDLLVKAEAQMEPSPAFVLRNSPFLDYMDPTLKIQQVVLNNITDDRYFRQVPKVDRCMTCHTFIDKPGFEDQANPFKTHPKLDLMVGADSPHSMKSVGCTSCHGGEGHRVNDFSSAAHTPENQKQEKEWVEKYHWHAPHKVPQIMYKLSQTEAGCVKCHGQEEFITGAPVLNEGRQNMEKYGCYACHKIEGWEHKRRPGPSLEKIAAKVDQEFFKNWVWNPKSFNAHAKMPTFFEQSNNSNPEFVKKNMAEVNAMAEFIWKKSKDYKPFTSYAGGNAETGKELIKQVGCLGCHGVEGLEEESKKIDAYAGPYLAGTGSKVSGDWLVSWLLKPSHYQPDSIMPSFRLSNKEANDIASYLLSLKNKKFEILKFEPLNKSVRDDLLIEYYTAFDTNEVAKQKLAKMSDHDRTMDLGERSVGKYGCYSCHKIEGFDGRAPIGPELTKVGSKPLTQFGFGHEHGIEHSRSGWIEAHLMNPRRWDGGVDKPFKDLLRMPNLYMTAKEAKTITVALLGQVADIVPTDGRKNFTAQHKIANESMKLVNKFNCVGCHQVDGHRGDILKMFDDINEGPPRLVDEGHRVQVDWFYHFLENVHPIRPWVKVRMPSFNLTNDEKNRIVAGFQAKADQPTFVDLNEALTWEPGEKEAAQQLFKSLDCASCHTIGFNSTDPTAPDLHYARKRLRPSWIKQWLRDPQKIMPGTIMPSFWENGVSTDDKILGGDADKQINALTKYLIEIGFDRYPPAFVKQP